MTPSQSKINAQSLLLAAPPANSLVAALRRGCCCCCCCCCCCLWREAKADLGEDKEDADKRKAWEKRATGRRRRRDRAWLRRGMVMIGCCFGSDLCREVMKASLTWMSRGHSRSAARGTVLA